MRYTALHSKDQRGVSIEICCWDVDISFGCNKNAASLCVIVVDTTVQRSVAVAVLNIDVGGGVADNRTFSNGAEWVQ